MHQQKVFYSISIYLKNQKEKLQRGQPPFSCPSLLSIRRKNKTGGVLVSSLLSLLIATTLIIFISMLYDSITIDGFKGQVSLISQTSSGAC